MAETGVPLHRGLRDAPCSNVPQRNLGRPQGHSWVKMGENILSRCTNDVNRHVFRVTSLVDDSSLRLAGSHMARLASWCEREEGSYVSEDSLEGFVRNSCCMFEWSQSWPFPPFSFLN